MSTDQATVCLRPTGDLKGLGLSVVADEDATRELGVRQKWRVGTDRSETGGGVVVVVVAKATPHTRASARERDGQRGD